MNPELIILLLAVIIGFLMFLYFVPINLWITAIFSGVKIELLELVFMRVRKSPVKDIVLSKIAAAKAGVPIKTVELETHALAGGNVTELTKALIKAKNEGIDVTLQELTATGLAGNDLMEFLEKSKSINRSKTQDLRQSISYKIMNDLTEDQVVELGRFLERMGGQNH